MSLPPAEAGNAARPSEADLAAIDCPVERVRAINMIARRHGTLSGQLSRLRTAALLQARTLTTTVTALAALVGMTRSRVSYLINQAPVEPGQ